MKLFTTSRVVASCLMRVLMLAETTRMQFGEELSVKGEVRARKINLSHFSMRII